MNISEIRRNIAQKQNEMLRAMFAGVGNDKFDFGQIDLSDFSIVELSDFWLASTGFLGVQAFDDYEFTDYEAKNILSGKFFLKDMTQSEAQRLLEESEVETTPNFNKYFDVTLSEIQDGTYSLVNERNRYTNDLYVRLETDPLEFINSTTIPVDNIQIIRFVRNVIAHDMPYINGLKLKFYGGDYEITTSKMWLRGLMEEFVFSSIGIDSAKLYDILMQKAYENNMQINNNQDVDKALSLIVDQFDDEIRSHYFRINNFIKSRVALIPDFFDKNLSEQLRIISVLISKNPNLLKSSSETINPSIIYNIIQIISKEIDRRGERALYEHQDIKSEEIDELLEEHERLIHEIAVCFSQKKKKELIRAINSNEKQLLYHQKRLQNIQKHETSSMNLLDIEELENLPVEVAFNLVCMMGFNALNTSEFFEDLVENVDAYSIDKNQKAFFSKFDLSKFTARTLSTNKQIALTEPNDVVMFLNGVRNALSHGNATYRLPNLKKNEKFDIMNITITMTSRAFAFEGKIIDFYNLFNSPLFFGSRPPEIFMGDPANLAELLDYEEQESGSRGNTSLPNDPKKFE